MTIRKHFIIGLMATTLGMSACHHRVPGGEGQNGTGDESGSQAYSMNGDASFGGDGSAQSRLQAPQNQTYYFEFDSNQIQQDDMGHIQAQGSYLSTHSSA